MAVSLLQVDAFTAEPFGGNPAAVCVLPSAQPEGWMQRVAAEMNLSETAFLVPLGDDPAQGYHLRWFTPTTEVDLCGHATLASAHVLWSEGHLPPQTPAQFQTRSGLLVARLAGDWITLEFPSQPVYALPSNPTLLQSLGVTPEAVVFQGSNRPDPVAEPGGNYFVELTSGEAVVALQPDFALMATLPAMGVIVTAPGAGAVDFVSRYFAPAVGIPEDPVTGSAHCALTPYWQAKLGKAPLLAHQVSPRGGVLKVEQRGDRQTPDADLRVYISGQAVTVLRGTLVAAAA